MFRCSAAICCLLVCCAAAAAQTHPDTTGEGWSDLYNGRDLTGWRTSGAWTPQADGVLALVPREGDAGWKRFEDYLWTEKTYGDFSLDLEYKIPAGGNSGVCFRIGDRADPVTTGIELQILDSHGKPDAEMTHHDAGGIIRTAAPLHNAAKSAGEWNRLTLTVVGSHLTAVLNGVLIQDVRLDDGPMQDRGVKGYIALQDHGQPVWFRDVRIKK